MRVERIYLMILLKNKATKAPRLSTTVNELTKTMSTDVRKSSAFFNMSGGRSRKDSDSTIEDDYIKELEEDNKRLKSLIEYKDYELQKKK